MAASSAESAKRTHYGASVLPVAFETCGRSGFKSMESLQFLLQDALLWGIDKQHSADSHGQHDLETVFAYQLADMALICLGESARRFPTHVMSRS